MHSRKSPNGLVTALILFCLLAAPAALESQCMVASTMVNGGGPTIQVYKILSGAYSCGTTMMNAVFCSPTAVMNTSFLVATGNTTMTVAPSCAWSCAGCPGSAPHVTIDGGDGLPVELMDFGFEDDEASSGSAEEAG